MIPLSRQIISSLTAGFVLLCHIYCACGSAGESSCHHSASPAVAEGFPISSGHPYDDEVAPCHRHQHESRHEPSDSGHRDHDGSHDHTPACQHCTPATASENTGTSLNAVWAFHAPLCSLLSPGWPYLLPDLAPADKPSVARDRSPPLPPQTLLGLHCALII